MQASSEFHASAKGEGIHLLALTIMCLSALAMGFILLSWFVGGVEYVRNFNGPYAMGVLAVAFVASAFLYGKTKKQSG